MEDFAQNRQERYLSKPLPEQSHFDMKGINLGPVLQCKILILLGLNLKLSIFDRWLDYEKRPRLCPGPLSSSLFYQDRRGKSASINALFTTRYENSGLTREGGISKGRGRTAGQDRSKQDRSR